MARMTKVLVIEALTKAGVEFDVKGKYNDLCKLLKDSTPVAAIIKPAESKAEDVSPTSPVRIENRRKKRNVFLADSVRDESDKTFLNAELRKRIYKGKIKKVTTIKHYDLIEGDVVTEFIIELKD